ncbi:uncharacterized protein BO97DRAFT_450076 [Aspergillus homomorphus CBS 101889]|uniref:Chitin-binding type-4 domain-containing protein n=1 Tax=Aspergillus homomorphus (strain CBS 101889) TaxID=1450537 RepID=A0A395I4U1_ASPHC|nr:hypothetical protein BO97DRAFT_450076 [Aspergillus homomorphus CBS 101889]RAL13394.1 hypothetical protein BO97DRAFT_450076 [Aspergillus homomorphus CBS 101889]
MNALISLSKAGLLVTLVSAAAAASCSTESGFEVTFYGYPDNSPPGADISYDCGRGYTAGGTGTHNDPLTFATAPGEFSKCQVIYSPYLQKYLRFEDECEQCTSDYHDGKLHIDIWTGSSTSDGGSKQLSCEDSLTPSASQIVVLNPPSTLAVNSGALFSSGTCHTSNTYPSASRSKSTYCSGSSSSPGSGGTTCAWEGHCEGTPCSSDNDCSDPWSCKSGVCA